MNQREKILQRVALKCLEFASQLSYHKTLSKYSKSFHQNFWICVFNNAIDLAVLDWLHLFGSYNDELHWKKVYMNTAATFKVDLLKNTGLDETKWDDYWQTVKEYRDKDVAHIEIRPLSNVPVMSIALEAANFYYLYVLHELSLMGNYSTLPCNLIDYYNKSLKQSEEIVTIAYNATREIENKWM